MHQTLTALAFAASVFVAGCASAPAPSEEAPPPRTFVYDDLERYNGAVASIRAGAAPAATFQTYLDGATPGMQVWLGIYPVTAEQLAAAYARRPTYYASLATLPARMTQREDEIARAYGRLEAMHPGAELGSVIYVVGRMTAGGTARPNGTMVGAEFFGRTEATDLSEFPNTSTLYDTGDLVQLVVHEGVHNLQRQMQGQENFISIYTNQERMTLRNFAIREGVADYVTDLLVGRVLPRHAFAEPREAEIWAEFQPIMNGTIFAQPGWFQGDFADGREWPNQVGYYVGYKMAEHIHRNAADPDAALNQILTPYTDEQFQAIAERYAAKFAP